MLLFLKEMLARLNHLQAALVSLTGSGRLPGMTTAKPDGLVHETTDFFAAFAEDVIS